MILAINRLYRILFCRGGHGVHSPFAFDLITNVIEERRNYYCYERLKSARKQLLQDDSLIICNNRKYTVKKALNDFCFSECEDRLLFRLANRFRPETICVLGSDLGLAPLYLTSLSEHSNCIVLEPEPSMATVVRKIFDKHSSASIDIHESCYPEIEDNCIIDLLVCGNTFINVSGEKEHNINAFSVDALKRFLPLMNDKSIMVISGINLSRKNRGTWKTICSFPEVTATFDLYSLGIVFFNPKLHRKTYKSIVL